MGAQISCQLLAPTGCGPGSSGRDLHGSLSRDGGRLIGILKAGGAYLPLDPAYPKERLAFMLEDAGASLLLTSGQPAGPFPTAGSARRPPRQ